MGWSYRLEFSCNMDIQSLVIVDTLPNKLGVRDRVAGIEFAQMRPSQLRSHNDDATSEARYRRLFGENSTLWL